MDLNFLQIIKWLTKRVVLRHESGAFYFWESHSLP